MSLVMIRNKKFGERHSHPGRQECIKVIAGKLLLRVESGHGGEIDKILNIGDSYWIQHWYHHQIQALEIPTIFINRFHLTDSGAMLNKEELL